MSSPHHQRSKTVSVHKLRRLKVRTGDTNG